MGFDNALLCDLSGQIEGGCDEIRLLTGEEDARVRWKERCSLSLNTSNCLRNFSTAQKCLHSASSGIVQVHPADVEIRLPLAGPSSADLMRNMWRTEGQASLLGRRVPGTGRSNGGLVAWKRVPLGGVRAGEVVPRRDGTRSKCHRTINCAYEQNLQHGRHDSFAPK
jgi:hypothetical protein